MSVRDHMDRIRAEQENAEKLKAAVVRIERWILRAEELKLGVTGVLGLVQFKAFPGDKADQATQLALMAVDNTLPAEFEPVAGTEESEYLTTQELKELPTGTQIEVIWGGGNGPHVYTLVFKHSQPYAKCHARDSGRAISHWLNHVGDTPMHHRVRKVVPAPLDRQTELDAMRVEEKVLARMDHSGDGYDVALKEIQSEDAVEHESWPNLRASKLLTGFMRWATGGGLLSSLADDLSALDPEGDEFGKCTSTVAKEFLNAQGILEYGPDIEVLAAVEHESWSNWMKYLHPRIVDDLDRYCEEAAIHGVDLEALSSVKRYMRQMNTDYEDLSEEEKESDRKVARKKLEAYA